MARREKNLSCLLLQLLMRLSVASEEAGDAGGALEFSLSPGQHRSLASILELTQEEGGDDSEEGCDSITLVRDADRAFTREASAGDRGSMWSVDEGLDADGIVHDVAQPHHVLVVAKTLQDSPLVRSLVLVDLTSVFRRELFDGIGLAGGVLRGEVDGRKPALSQLLHHLSLIHI